MELWIGEAKRKAVEDDFKELRTRGELLEEKYY